MIRTECRLSGKEFYPSKLQEGVLGAGAQMQLAIDPGQIGTRGRFKNQPEPYGHCTMSPPNEIQVADRIDWMIEFVSKNISLFKKNGATDIVFDLYWSGTQGNMELTAHQLRNLGNLQIPLAITYVYNSE
jgi:hypothetical protein